MSKVAPKILLVLAETHPIALDICQVSRNFPPPASLQIASKLALIAIEICAIPLYVTQISLNFTPIGTCIRSAIIAIPIG
jgi:hypothetical protein